MTLYLEAPTLVCAGAERMSGLQVIEVRLLLASHPRTHLVAALPTEQTQGHIYQ